MLRTFFGTFLRLLSTQHINTKEKKANANNIVLLLNDLQGIAKDEIRSQEETTPTTPTTPSTFEQKLQGILELQDDILEAAAEDILVKNTLRNYFAEVNNNDYADKTSSDTKFKAYCEKIRSSQSKLNEGLINIRKKSPLAQYIYDALKKN